MNLDRSVRSTLSNQIFKSGSSLITNGLVIVTILVSTVYAQRPAAQRTMSEQEVKRQDTAFAPRNALDCSQKPTQAEINTADLIYQDYYMSAKRAASIGIPIVNASGESDYLVIVRDYRRFKPCTATDGKTIIHYGQVIRAVIELTDYKAEVKLTLASIAANATISGKQQYFYLYKSGWFNSGADAVLTSVSGKVFDVENYGLYQSVMPKLIDLLKDAQTAFSPSQIFLVPPEDDPAYVMASARAYAFAQAKDGKSCQDASKKFATDPARAAAVVDAYAFIGKPNCTNEKIVEPQKSKAAALLGGLSVK
jgi:hypothetical protein